MSDDRLGRIRYPGFPDDGLAVIMGAMGGCLNVHESPDLGTTVSLYSRPARSSTSTRFVQASREKPDEDGGQRNHPGGRGRRPSGS